jgi:hypothetical protein
MLNSIGYKKTWIACGKRDGLSDRLMKKGAQLCENLCEKNFPKSAKIGKNRKKCGKSNVMISVAYNNFRRLGNSEVLTVNHRVRGSSPCWGAK